MREFLQKGGRDQLTKRPSGERSLRRLRQLFPDGAFVRGASELLAGTTISQAVLVLASPLLSRLYSPEQFGSAALFVAFAGILGIASTGRFELAIALPASDDDAFNLLAVAICTT